MDVPVINAFAIKIILICDKDEKLLSIDTKIKHLKEMKNLVSVFKKSVVMERCLVESKSPYSKECNYSQLIRLRKTFSSKGTTKNQQLISQSNFHIE